MFKFVVVIIPLMFSLFLYWIDATNWSEFALIGSVVGAVIVTIAAHFLLLGKVPLATLPLGWALCLIPAYIYSYHIEYAGYFGHSFTFITVTAFCIVPPGVVAILLSIISFIRSCINK